MGVVAARTVWAAIIVVTLGLLVRGVRLTFYFEPTGDAIAEERQGHRLILLGCVLILGCAVAAATALRASPQAAALVAVPVPASLLAYWAPLIALMALVVACVVAVAATVVVLSTRR